MIFQMIFFSDAPGFAAFVIVGNDHGVFIKQYALQPSVWTNHDTDLLAEISVYKVKNKAEDHNCKEATQVVANRFGNDLLQFMDPDDIGQ